MSQARTAEDFFKELEDQNISVSQWCRNHQASTNTVWSIARGVLVGRGGEARRVMKLMGLPVPSMRRDHPQKAKAAAKRAQAAQGAAA